MSNRKIAIKLLNNDYHQENLERKNCITICKFITKRVKHNTFESRFILYLNAHPLQWILESEKRFLEIVYDKTT